VAAAVAVHFAALLALNRTSKMDLQIRSGLPEPDAPGLTVDLVRLPAGTGLAVTRSPDIPPPRPAPGLAATGALISFPVRTAPPSPLNGAREDDDPLFRVPFRDAVAQASAGLRGGLGCAHVDLTELPRPVLDLCAGALRRGARIAGAKPSEHPAGGIDEKWTVDPHAGADAGPGRAHPLSLQR
jgi:hypothetical protein